MLLPGLFQRPGGQVDQAKPFSRLGQVHLSAQVPRVARQQFFALFEHLQVVTGLLGSLDPCPDGPGGEPGKFAAAQIVLVLGLLGAAQRLAIDEIGGIELATVNQQPNSIVVIARGNDLVGALELSGGSATLLRTGRR